MRLYRAGSATNTRFAYDGSDLIAEYDANGTLVKRYVHGPGVDEPLVEYLGTDVYTRRWLHADERGSIVAVTNTGGTIAYNSYDEYGKPAASNVGRFQYTGQTWLPEIGRYYYKARMYDPKSGRFLQVDPLLYGDGMNPYIYTHNDPVNFTDPTGMMEQRCWQQSNHDGYSYAIVENGEIVETVVVANTYSTQCADFASFSDPRSFNCDASKPRGPSACEAVDLACLGPFRIVGQITDACSRVLAPLLRAFKDAAAHNLAKKLGLTVRKDVIGTGGRSGQNLRNGSFPPNSVFRHSQEPRVYISDRFGNISRDITWSRTKFWDGSRYMKQSPTVNDRIFLRSFFE